MQKTIFTNNIFYWLLLAYLSLLISWNVYAFSLGQFFAVLPVSLQLALLYLILKKHKLAKIGVTAWSVLLMLGPGLAILGKILKVLTGDSLSLMIPQLLESFCFFLVGLSIFYFNKNTVVVDKIELSKAASSGSK